MTTGLQRARMTAVRAALASLRAHRHRRFAPGYDLVVSGGAYTPGTNTNTNTNSDNLADFSDVSFDSYDLRSPQSPLPPTASLGLRLVVSGGDVTTARTRLEPPIISFLVCATADQHTHRIFRPLPSHSPYADAFYSVVLGCFRPWPRMGLG